MEKDTELLEKEVKTPAETDGDFKEDTSPKKTAMQELKDKIALLQKFSLAWTIISMIISTGFLIYSVLLSPKGMKVTLSRSHFTPAFASNRCGHVARRHSLRGRCTRQCRRNGSSLRRGRRAHAARTSSLHAHHGRDRRGCRLPVLASARGLRCDHLFHRLDGGGMGRR